jgi:hypothetical protein
MNGHKSDALIRLNSEMINEQELLITCYYEREVTFVKSGCVILLWWI